MGKGRSNSYNHWREHHDETHNEDQNQDMAMDEDRSNERLRRRSASYNQESYDRRLRRRSGSYNQDSHEDQSEYDDPVDNAANTYTDRPQRRSLAQDENGSAEGPRRRSVSARNPVPSASKGARPVHRKRKVWPMLLTGCALGVVFAVVAAAIIVLVTIRSLQSNSNLPNLPGFGIGSKPFTKLDVLKVPLPTVSQIQICDRMGDVTMKVDPDPNASKITVETSKIVQVANQAAADQEFQHILVEVQPPTALTQPLTCAKAPSTASSTTSIVPTPLATSPAIDNQSTTLTVNVTFPSSGNVNDKVNINVTFPQSALQSAGPALLVDVEAPLGKVNLDGISGLLNVKGGDTVTVQHAILADQSQLETANGSVNFSGFLALPTDPNQKAKYLIQGENGIDVTLPAQTNVLLDANTNQGTGVINNEFNTTNSNHTAINYYGPIDPAVTLKPTAILQLDVGSGNVNIHKTQTP